MVDAADAGVGDAPQTNQQSTEVSDDVAETGCSKRTPLMPITGFVDDDRLQPQSVRVVMCVPQWFQCVTVSVEPVKLGETG
jgi:hypothetical protein